MDRNSFARFARSVCVRVALRKESVDRNLADDAHFVTVGKSLSARRAWIEIFKFCLASLFDLPSLSARRAWIEIFVAITPSNFSNVALRKESVDRNL